VKIFLIGNKVDTADRMVQKDSGVNFQLERKLDYFNETSAKTGFNSKAVFLDAARLLYTEHLQYKNMKHNETIRTLDIIEENTKKVRGINKRNSLKLAKKCC